MSALTSLGLIPAALAAALKSVSKFLMVAALAAIGLNTNFKALCRSGAKPMLHGFIVSLLVVLVAIAVEYAIGVAPSGTLQVPGPRTLATARYLAAPESIWASENSGRHFVQRTVKEYKLITGQHKLLPGDKLAGDMRHVVVPP